MSRAALPAAAIPPVPPFRVALMMALCCACVAASTFFAKMLGSGAIGAPMHPFEVVFGRYVFALAALAIVAAARGVRLDGLPWRLIATRASFGTAGVAGLFAAAAMIPLADATAISFLNPVFAMPLAMIFLGERPGPWRWSAAAIALAGGLILIRPGFGAAEPSALIALAAAILMAAEVTVVKVLARRETVLRGLLGTNLVATGISALAVLFVWRTPSGAELVALAAVGLCMVAGQTLFTTAIQRADSSFVTPMFYGILIFAALYDALWFGTVPTALSCFGAGLIVLGAAVIAIREARDRRAA